VGKLPEQVEDSFRFLPVSDCDEQLDSGHGRVETRRCIVVGDLSLIESKEEWGRIKVPDKNKIGTFYQDYR
jgi:hypothetical protein